MCGLGDPMPHHAKLLDNLGVIVLRFWGDITYEELQHVFDEVPAMPGFRKGLKLVADFRECRTALTGVDVQRLAHYAKRVEAAWGETKWAILATNDVIYGLTRIYMALTSEYDIQTHVFRSVEQAEDWLGLGIGMSELVKPVEN